MPPSAGFSGTSNLKETLGKGLKRPKGLHVPSDPRVPQDLPGGEGSRSKREGHLGHFASPAVTVIRACSCRKGMNANASQNSE